MKIVKNNKIKGNSTEYITKLFSSIYFATLQRVYIWVANCKRLQNAVSGMTGWRKYITFLFSIVFCN
jgi:hypothetical protein